MRLNRVLQLNRVPLLAAGISVMVFALIFTISCSDGSDGKPGKNGVGCTIVKDGSWKIFCDGVEKGELTGDAPTGLPGDPGAPGRPGDGCVLGEKNPVTASYEILCGNTISGYLDGCAVNKFNSDEISITCGSTAVGLCKGEVFNPETHKCGGSGVEDGPSTDNFLDCEGTTYDKRTHYCGFTKADTLDGANASHIYEICNGINGTEKPNSEKWKNEYCEYRGPDIFNAKASTTVCGDSTRINEGEWKGQYCGLASNLVKVTTALSGVCDFPGKARLAEGGSSASIGPNQIAFGQGYCAINSEGKTIYSEIRCGTVANRPNDVSRLKPADIADIASGKKKFPREYCGFASSGSAVRDVLRSDMCDDGQGPDASSASFGYCGCIDADCTYPAKIWVKSSASGSPYLVPGEYHIETSSATGGTQLLTTWCTAPDSKGKRSGPNAGTWKDEYCGYASNNSASSVSAKNICDYQTLFSSSGGTIYRVVYSSSAGGVAALIGRTSATGVHQDFYNSGYNGTTSAASQAFCTYDPNYRKTRTSGYDDFCTDPKGAITQLNKDKWKGEYCLDGNKLYKDACDDGKRPYSSSSATTYWFCGWTQSSSGSTLFAKCGNGDKINETKWNGEYCGWDTGKSASSESKKFGNLCGDGIGPNMLSSSSGGYYTLGGFCRRVSATSTTTIHSAFCGPTGAYNNPYSSSSYSAYNKDTWQNEYCFSGEYEYSSSSTKAYIVAKCPGGWIGDESKYGKLTATERCYRPSSSSTY